jgi:hypothetical protein
MGGVIYPRYDFRSKELKKGEAVSYKQLNSALFDVQEELYKVGLWDEGAPLTETEVVWSAWPQLDVPGASGYFLDGLWGISGVLARLLGYEVGKIYIPKWVLLHGFWQNRGSLRDVIRHEYGHAIIYRHPREGKSKAFQEAFGGCYDEDIRGMDEPDCYVSEYARLNPAEDFSETFQCFLRNPSRKLTGPKALQKKFEYVRSLCEKCSG